MVPICFSRTTTRSHFGGFGLESLERLLQHLDHAIESSDPVFKIFAIPKKPCIVLSKQTYSTFTRRSSSDPRTLYPHRAMGRGQQRYERGRQVLK